MQPLKCLILRNVLYCHEYRKAFVVKSSDTTITSMFVSVCLCQTDFYMKVMLKWTGLEHKQNL